MAAIDEEQAAIVEVSAENMPESRANLRARSLQVRSKLGEELFRLIQADLPDFYKVIRDAAFGNSKEIPRDIRGNPARSSGNYLAAHRKMYIDLMKMANADVNVDSADINGDLEAFQAQLRGLSTEDLQRLVKVAEGE